MTLEIETETQGPVMENMGGPLLCTSVDALGALEELQCSLKRVNLLMDACDAWLRDANNGEKYDIGARAGEIMVTYWEPDPDDELNLSGESGRLRKRKQSLEDLLRLVGGSYMVLCAEPKHADPRELILKTAQEVRRTVSEAAKLARTLSDMRAMEAFRATLLREIVKVSPEIAGNIAEAVRRAIVLNNTAGGAEALVIER
jgi:hypothetical protein